MEAEKISGNSPPNLQHTISKIFLGGSTVFFFGDEKKQRSSTRPFPSKIVSPQESSSSPGSVVADDFEVRGFSSDHFSPPWLFAMRERVHEKLIFMFSYTTSYRNNIYIYIYTPGVLYIYQLGWFICIYICVTYTTLSTFGSWKTKSARETTKHLQAVQLSTGAWLTASQLGEATSWENCWLVEGFLRIPKP